MNYTYLHLGDKLPSVGVLQKLLNRACAKLEPDGVFGPKTEAAVRHFQELHHLKHDGIVGEKTWPKLVEGVELPIVDSVDVFDSFQKEEYLRKGEKKKANDSSDSLANEVDDIQSVGGNPFVIGGMSNGVQQVLSMISAASRDAFLLRFHGHGYSGSVGISCGAGGPNRLNRMNEGSIPGLFKVISHLSRVFGPYGSLQFMSCHTGLGKDGRDMVNEISGMLDVPVTAGIHMQYGGGLNTFKFEGKTFTAVPHGQTLKQWCQSLPDFDA
jgi:hypothetical protein